MTPEDRARKWARVAFEAEVSKALTAGSGARNDVLIASALRCIELSNAMPSEVSRGEAVERLLEAGVSAGLSPREVRTTIRSAERQVGDRRAELPRGYRDDFAPAPSFRAVQALARRVGHRSSYEATGHKRPPRAEVRALWEACEPVSTIVLATLSGRERQNIDPGEASKRHLVRRLPDAAALPGWARCWPSGHRVIVPLYDASGELVSLRARAEGDPGRAPKELGAKGFEVRGTIMANPIGRDLLRGDEFTRAYVQHVGVVLVEGCPGWLAWSSRWAPTFESEPAAFGYFVSGWSQRHSDAIPDGTTVLVDWDANPAGERMRDKILATLGERVRLRVTTARRAA